MTSPTPEDAVRVARVAAVEGRGIGPAVTAGVVQAVDEIIAEVDRLQALVDGDATLRDSESYRLALADAAAAYAATPRLPALAPPRQAPTRAMKALERIRTVIQTRAVRARKPNDPPGEATGPLVVRVDLLQAAISPPPASETPAAPTGAV